LTSLHQEASQVVVPYTLAKSKTLTPIRDTHIISYISSKTKKHIKYDNHSFEWRRLRKLLFHQVHQNISSPSLQPPHYHSPIGTEDRPSPKNYEKGG
jgi:hypothetical protein